MKNLLFIVLFSFFSIGLIAQSDILPPELIAPEDGEINQMPDVQLNWYASSGVGSVSYTIEIATNSEFENAETFTTSVTNLTTSNLKFGVVYFWRVSATDDNGPSEWSDIFSFTVFSRVLLDTPDSGAEDQMPDVILSRAEDAGGDDYSGFSIMECQIDTAYSLANINIGLTDEDLNSIYFMDEDTGWIVGNMGTILAYENGMWSFDTIYSGITSNDTTIENDLNSINNGHIVGSGGTFIYYENNQWILDSIQIEVNSEDSTIVEDLNSVFAISNENIWAVGNDGVLLHKGTSQYWEVDGNFEVALFSLFFLDENNGWAVGEDGLILYYNGSEWTEQTSPVSKDLYSIYFTDIDNGWTSGKSGDMAFYNGSEWVEIESNTNKDLNEIRMISPHEGWAVGKDGTLVTFDGDVWYESTSNSLNTLNSLVIIDEDNIYLVGIEGIVITKIGEGFNSGEMEILTTIGDSINIYTDNLLFGTRYYWRFRTIHEQDTSSWSSARYFSTIEGIDLISPSQNATNQDPDISLNWEEITGVDSYIYQVCNDPDFVFPCITGFADTNSVIVPNLFFGNTYYWRLKAAHFTDTTEWSEVRTFEVINTVFLDSPSDGASSIDLKPTITWDLINGADEYEARWMNEDFSYLDTAFVDTNSFAMFIPLEYAEDYFWKVRAIKNGDTTNWSDTWQFFTGPQGINPSFNDQSINIFPNPASDQLTVEINSLQATKINVLIIDLMGKIVQERSFNFDQGLSKNIMQLDQLHEGIYLIKLQSGNDVYTKKLVID